MGLAPDWVAAGFYPLSINRKVSPAVLDAHPAVPVGRAGTPSRTLIASSPDHRRSDDGTSLATAGNVLQMVFRNPLVGPGVLGISQGAAFGATLNILLISTFPLAVELTALFFALAGLTISYLIVLNIHYGGWILRLILSGIAASAQFSAGVGLIKYLAHPLNQLPETTFCFLEACGASPGVKLSSCFLS